MDNPSDIQLTLFKASPQGVSSFWASFASC